MGIIPRDVTVFQSTPPVWGATGRACSHALPTFRFQSTPPVWGATAEYRQRVTLIVISIHAPRVGGDACLIRRPHMSVISIHAPRVGGDLSSEGR